jgi:Fe-S-cluster containining protein
MTYRPPPGFAFDCVGCGSCCTCQNIGPLAAAEVDALRQSQHPDLLALHERVPGGLFRRASQDDGSGVQLICRQKPLGCVFLQPDGLCRVHAALGPEGKPTPCRMFPYRLIDTPEGVDVTLLSECRQWLRARRAGESIPRATYEAGWDALSALERKRVPFPAAVPLRGGRTLAYADYRAWEDRAEATIAAWQQGTLPALVARVAGSLATDAGLESPPPSASPETLHDLLLVLREFLAQAMDEYPATSGPESGTHAWTAALADSLDLAPLYASRLTSDRLSPDARELVREGYLNYLHGKGWLAFGDLALGLAVANLMALLVLNLAYHRARVGRRLAADPLDVQDATTTVYMLARARLFRVFVEHRAEALQRELLDEADGLEARWSALGTLWDGPEMYVL